MIKHILLAGASALAFAATSAEAAAIFDYTGQVVQWTAPNSGLYEIQAFGGQGGGGGDGVLGGLGALIGGDFQLRAGETLNVMVGALGANNYAGGGGGGGGASGVSVDHGPLLLLAGGGGGGGIGHGSGVYGGGFASFSPGPGSNGGFGGFGGPGGPGGGYGANGLGGIGGGYGGGFGGGGGGGFTGGDGGRGYFKSCETHKYKQYCATSGGYGGGGGGSFNASATLRTTGYHLGVGRVTIDLLSAGGVPEPSTWSLMLTGLGFLGYVLRRRVMRRASGARI